MIFEMKSLLKEYKYNAVLLRVDNNRFGTAFFLSYELQDQSQLILLITNRHVIKDSKYLSFECLKNGDNKISIKFDLEQSHYILPEDFNMDFDIFAFPFLLKNKEHITFVNEPEDKSIKPSDISIGYIDAKNLILSYENLNVSDKVVSYGFPGGLYDKYNMSSIWLEGVFSTDPNDNFNGEKIFTINNDSRGGNSGSPVIYISDGIYYLIGIIRSGRELLNHTECIKLDFFHRLRREIGKDGENFVVKEVW